MNGRTAPMKFSQKKLFAGRYGAVFGAINFLLFAIVIGTASPSASAAVSPDLARLIYAGLACPCLQVI